MTSVDQPASLAWPAALQVAYARERGACVEASAGAGGSSAQVNAASEGACVVTSGPFVEGDTAADGLLDTFLAAQVEAGKGEGQSQDPAEGSLTWGSGLVVHWGVLGRTGAHHWGVRAEEGPSHLGGWRWELEASTVLPVVEIQAVMSS